MQPELLSDAASIFKKRTVPPSNSKLSSRAFGMRRWPGPGIIPFKNGHERFCGDGRTGFQAEKGVQLA